MLRMTNKMLFFYNVLDFIIRWYSKFFHPLDLQSRNDLYNLVVNFEVRNDVCFHDN